MGMNHPAAPLPLDAEDRSTLDPPGQAVVLCVDEKSQIQAPDRTPAGPADEAGSLRHHDPRLQAPVGGGSNDEKPIP